MWFEVMKGETDFTNRFLLGGIQTKQEFLSGPGEHQC